MLFGQGDGDFKYAVGSESIVPEKGNGLQVQIWKPSPHRWMKPIYWSRWQSDAKEKSLGLLWYLGSGRWQATSKRVASKADGPRKCWHFEMKLRKGFCLEKACNQVACSCKVQKGEAWKMTTWISWRSLVFLIIAVWELVVCLCLNWNNQEEWEGWKHQFSWSVLFCCLAPVAFCCVRLY